VGFPLRQLMVIHCKRYNTNVPGESLIFTPLSIATCVNDDTIPLHMQKWLNDLKMKQKKEHGNLLFLEDDSEDEGDGNEEREDNGTDDGTDDSDDSSSGDDEPPAKRLRMSRMSVDAQIVQDGLLVGLDVGRMTRSVSRSSRASSVASYSDF